MTKLFKINFTLGISEKESYSSIVNTSITNDVPKGEDPEVFLKKRLKEEINRMMRSIDELDFEVNDDDIL